MPLPKKYLYIPVVALPIFVVDQITKWMIDTKYMLGESTPVIQGFFSLTYVRNKGAAFGFMANAPPGFREVFLSVVPVIALFLVAMFYRNIQAGQKLMPLALSLVIGGAVGNLVDRVRFKYVIDFLDFYVGHYHWPAFNVADSAICVGIGMMAYHMIFLEKKMTQTT